MSESAANNVSVYGEGAILPSDAPSDAELAMIQKASNVEVRDGDQFVDIDVPEDGAEDSPNDNPEENQEETPKDKPQEGSDDDVQAKVTEAQKALEDVGKDLQTKGVDVQALMDEYSEGNSLSDKSYEALAKAGYSKAVVDSIITGQVATANSFTNSVLAAAGGEEGFKQLTEFAQTASPATIPAFNAAVERGDLATTKALLAGLQAQRAAKYGTANKQIKGSPVNVSKPAVEGYANRQDMVKAMDDSRYGRDPSYTRSVEAKVGASSFF